MPAMSVPGVRTKPPQVKIPAIPRVGHQFQSLSQQVYAALFHAIANRRIRPGERLRLDTLAAELGVSRTPIRDALSRLAAEGLVRSTGRTALCVTQFGAEELTHLYDLRLMCELYALEKGFGAVTATTLEELERCSAELVRLGGSADPADRVGMSLADRKFHQLLVGLAKNPRLDEFYARLNIHIHGVRVGPSPLLPRTRAQVNATEHRAILRALRSKRLPAAREAVRIHIQNGLTRVIESLRLVEAEAASAPARPGRPPDRRRKPPRSRADRSRPAPSPSR